jgi:hypothetical protein
VEAKPVTNALRPLGLGELLDRSFFLYRKHFLLFVGIVALPHLVLLTFQLMGIVLFPRIVPRMLWLNAIWGLASMVVYLAIVAVSQGATVLAVSKVHLDHEASVGESFAGMKGRILEICLIMIGLGIGVGMGLVLFVIPGIILFLMWSLTIPVAVLEETGLRDSVARSAALTKGSRGRIFAIFFLFFVLTYIVYILWEIPLFAILGIFTRSHHAAIGFPFWARLVFPIGGFLSQALVAPLLTIALSLVYYDQRVRKEGFDLQLMMSQLDAGQNAANSATA